MPELPDVENFRRYSRKALNKKIKEVSVSNKKMLEVPESALKSHLKGKKLAGTDRIGKYLLLKISGGYVLVLHFGMTGELKYYKEGKEPKHTIIILKLANGYNFAFICVRKLGLIDIVKNKKELIKKKELGPDAAEISRKDFMKIMKQAKGSIKASLMDQSKIAGIGNIYSDEILYQAKMHPEKRTEGMKESEIKKLYTVMKKVFKISLKNNADPKKMPNNYIIERRGAGEKCGICSGKIKRIKVGGRSAYFCPKHQKK